MKYLNKRASAVRSLVAIGALVLLPTMIAAATKCRSSDFACFKRKLMPKVGRKTTVVGALSSAKLGWIVRFDDWGVYIYAVQTNDAAKMNDFAPFEGQTIKVTGTLRHSAGSGSTRSDEAIVPEHFYFDLADARVISPRPAAAIEFREMRLRTPPLAELYFDVRLRNDRSAARWFLLPSNLGSANASIGAKGGVDTLEVFAPRGQGRVIIGHFLGTGGFQALLLPPRAEVRLRLFPISYWGDPPDRLRIEVVIAKTFSIGGETAEKWFGSRPLSSVKADITENAKSTSRMLRSKHTPDDKEVATRIEEDRRLQLMVSLAPKE